MSTFTAALTLPEQIVAALANLREARRDGNTAMIAACAGRLDRLLDRLPRTTTAQMTR